MATEQELADPHGPHAPDTHPKAKRFIPLENNPEVMTALVHELGLSPKLAFHDVYSIDDAELLAFTPRPAHALLLVFPVSDTYEAARRQEDAALAEYAGCGPDEPVVWYKQTIGNACGLIGLLHSVSNGAARSYIEPSSALSGLVAAAVPLAPAARAALLYESGALEAAHQAAAAGGASAAPAAAARVDLHYVCFVRAADGRLWELDGRRKGPLERGALAADDDGDDVLSERALELGVRRFLRREMEAGGGELRFSLVALGPSLD